MRLGNGGAGARGAAHLLLPDSKQRALASCTPDIVMWQEPVDLSSAAVAVVRKCMKNGKPIHRNTFFSRFPCLLCVMLYFLVIASCSFFCHVICWVLPCLTLSFLALFFFRLKILAENPLSQEMIRSFLCSKNLVALSLYLFCFMDVSQG